MRSIPNLGNGTLEKESKEMGEAFQSFMLLAGT